MSRKDYVALAKIVADSSERFVDKSAMLGLATDIAKYLKQDNSSFDTQRFLKACNVTY